jgi:hypothetical protein
LRPSTGDAVTAESSTPPTTTPEEPQRNVHPVHINLVRHVNNHDVIYSAAENVEELLDNLRELREGQNQLGKLLEAKDAKSNYDQAHEVFVEICHYGEMLLLHQRWLAEDLVAGGFLNAKEAIHHWAHKPHREASLLRLPKTA